MKLLEYKAKELFEKHNIPTMNGIVVSSTKNLAIKIANANLNYPVVIKAQVQIGGRGKAGGIKFAEDASEAQKISQELLFSTLKGFKVNSLLIVEKASPKTELYLSIMLDRLNKCPLVIFSEQGGVDIEEISKTSPDKILKIPLSPILGIKDYVVNYIISKTSIDKKYSAQIKDILTNLLSLFSEYDCLLAEINPLVINEDDSIIALDGKIDIDESSLYRHKDIQEFRQSLQENTLVKEARSFNFLYIPIESEGNIAVMSNGSGMLMSCIDLISKKEMKVASALDLGGGATAERIKEAIRIVLSNRSIDTLFISIFGGITRCDEVAKGIKLAMENQKESKKLIVRLEGTNKNEGIEIINSIKGNVISVESIPEGVDVLYSKEVF